SVRQMNIQLAKDRYKQGFKVRTQEYIRGRGTLAIVDEEICMGCTHCFDNCAFEAIGMVDRKFALPEYSYTSRKAVIIDDNRVGPQGPAADSEAGDSNDPEPPAGPAGNRHHEDRRRLLVGNRLRRTRHGAVSVLRPLRASRGHRGDATDPNPDRHVHRMPRAAAEGRGDLHELRRTADVNRHGEISGCTTWASSISSLRDRTRLILRRKFGSSSHRWARRLVNAAPGVRVTIARTPFERSYTLVRSFGAEKNG